MTAIVWSSRRLERFVAWLLVRVARKSGVPASSAAPRIAAGAVVDSVSTDVAKFAAAANLALRRPAAQTRQMEDFLNGNASPAGDMLHEFMARKDVQRALHAVPATMRHYAFPWGFILEEHGVWNFYVAQAWQGGTVQYFDRFLSAWKNTAEPELARAVRVAGNNFYVSFDDGGGAFCCISLACVLDERGQRLAREWVADAFLPYLWPLMMEQALDLDHQFAQEWHCA